MSWGLSNESTLQYLLWYLKTQKTPSSKCHRNWIKHDWITFLAQKMYHLKTSTILRSFFVAVMLLNWQYWTSLAVVVTFLSLCIRLFMQRLDSAGLFACIVSALPSFSPHNTWMFVCVCVNHCVCSLGFERSPPPPPLLCSSPPPPRCLISYAQVQGLRTQTQTSATPP